MAEYIERGEVREAFYMEFDEDYADDIVNRLPTADVQEVRHGEWADYADSFWGRIGRMDLRCSLCGKRASSFVGGTEDWWDNYKPNYCPHCGAKMDK